MQADSWQDAFLNSQIKRIILLCSRQSGKSESTASLLMRQALVFPRSLILILSPSARQSGEIYAKAIRQWDTIGRPVKAEKATLEEIRFANGSRIVALPDNEGKIRSFSGVDLLVIDEASRVSDEVYGSVRPMLAVSQGKLILLSTPFGKRGFFWEEWDRGGPGWYRVRLTADQCPRITRTFLEEERRSRGERWVRQEYMCSFEASLDGVFREEDIQRSLDLGLNVPRRQWPAMGGCK